MRTRKWENKRNQFTKKPYLIANSVKQHKNTSKYYVISSKTLQYDIKNGENNVIPNNWNDESVIKLLD